MKSGATCIIPLYNEEQNICRVLSEFILMPFLTQIICVDDGSTDNSAEEISRNFPLVELIRLPVNQGKSYAVREGLKHAKNDDILLFDADMQNILQSELTTSYNLFTSQETDMLILGWKCTNAILRAARGDIIISGGRWLKKHDLEKIFESLDFKGFALEVAINYYMISGKKVTHWYQTSAENTLKTEKYGFVKGLKSTFAEGFSIVSSDMGIVNQFFNFKPKKMVAEVVNEDALL